MTQEEIIIRQHDSGRRPFTVPEGYFESFGGRLKARMQAEGLTSVSAAKPVAVRLPLWRKVIRYAAVAASAAVVIGGAWYYSMHRPSGAATLPGAAQAEYTEFNFTGDELNAALDYELVDNQHIAYYLTEAY